MRVEGVIAINGAPSNAGAVLVVEKVGGSESCGSEVTTEAGAYSLTVGPPCVSGQDFVIVLQQVDPRAESAAVELGPVGERQTFNPTFSLTSAQEADLPQPPVADEEGAAGQALVQRTTSVFDEVETLLLFLLISGAILLTVMAGALLVATRSRYQFLTTTFESISKDSPEALEMWKGAIEAENKAQEGRYAVFRWMVEGLVMSFVVIALIALGAAGKIEAQGIVSVLAAMVDYAAGRVTS